MNSDIDGFGLGPTSSPRYSFSHVRILVVEDDDAVGGVILEMLSRWKMDAVRAAGCSTSYRQKL